MERKKLTTSQSDAPIQSPLVRSSSLRKGNAVPHNYRYRELTTPTDALDVDAIPEYEPPARGKPPAIADLGVYAAILEKVREGNFLAVAARYAGVSSDAVLRYLEKGKAGENRLYYEFYVDMCEAEAQAEANRLATLNGQADMDWRAGIEILARRWPERWAKKDFRQISVAGKITQETKSVLAVQLLEDPESRALARELIKRQAVTVEGELDDGPS